MAQLDVYDLDNKKVGSIDLSDDVFAAPERRYLLTEIVHWQRAKRRRGTQSALRKGEINATTKKPFKQKGTGNARQGDWKSPHHVGGGVALAPKPRSYDYQMPKTKRRVALATALSLRVKEGGFSGREAQLLEITGNEGKFILQLLGKEHLIAMPLSGVEAA